MDVQIARRIQDPARDRAVLDGDVLVVAIHREDQPAPGQRQLFPTEIDDGGDGHAREDDRHVRVHRERVHRRVHREAGDIQRHADVVRGERLTVEDIRRIPRKPRRAQRTDPERRDIAGKFTIHDRPRPDEILRERRRRGDHDTPGAPDESE